MCLVFGGGARSLAPVQSTLRATLQRDNYIRGIGEDKNVVKRVCLVFVTPRVYGDGQYYGQIKIYAYFSLVSLYAGQFPQNKNKENKGLKREGKSIS